MNSKYFRCAAGLLLVIVALQSDASGDILTGWSIGEQAPNFGAFYLDETTGLQTSTSWHQEYGADVYVVSTCAMWCAPCQQFAQQADAIAAAMASEQIDVQLYDLIFQNNRGLEPGASDAQAWNNNVWTSSSENVWFGGEISESDPNSVTFDIFQAIQDSGGSGQAIPAIVVMDRNFVVQDLQEGFLRTRIEDSIRTTAVPEPGCFLLLVGVGMCLATRRSRRLPKCNQTRVEFSHRNGLIRLAAFVFALPSAFLATTSPSYAQSTVETLVTSGDLTPTGDGTYADFFFATLNDGGGVSFMSNLNGTSNGTANSSGVFTIKNNSATEIVRQGDQVLGGAFTMGFPSLFGFNDQDDVLVSGSLTDNNGSVAQSNLFVGDGTSFSRIRAVGDPAPGGNGAFGNGFSVSNFNSAGQFAMLSSLTGTSGGNNDGVGMFFFDGNQFQNIVRKGDAAVAGGGTFQSFGSSFTNSSGDVLFAASYTGSADQKSSIIMGSAGNLTQIVREGDATPDGNGVFFGSFSFDFNDQRQVAFGGNTIGNSGPSGGVFLSTGSMIQQIVREGDLAPDGNGSLSGISNAPQLNNIGQVGFVGDFSQTSGGNADTRGILRASTEGLTQIARMGQAVPNTGTTISSLATVAKLNDSGQMLFRGNLVDPNGSENSALLTGDGIDLMDVVQVGDRLGSSFISSVDTTLQLNKYGQVLYKARLLDGNNVLNLWTPRLGYRKQADGDWDDNQNWTLSLNPDQVHHVSIRPIAASFTVTGPDGARTVRSLSLGDTLFGGPTSKLQLLASSRINASEAVFVQDNGRLAGMGVIDSPVIVNQGLISGSITLNGSVDVQGNGLIQANSGDSLTINGDLVSPNAIAINNGGQVTVNGGFNFGNSNVSTGSGTLALNGAINDTSQLSAEQHSFGGHLSLGTNANSVFQFIDRQNFDRWNIAGDLSLGGSLTVETESGFDSLGFNQDFLIQDVAGTRSGQFVGLNEGGTVGTFGGQQLFISYAGGDGNDTLLFTERVPQWNGGTGSWHDSSNWINGTPTPTSKTVLLDNDPNIDSIVSTAGANFRIQSLQIDAGDTLRANIDGGGRGRMTFDSADNFATLRNDGLVEVAQNSFIASESDRFEISGDGILRLQGSSANLSSKTFAGGDLIINAAGHTIEGQGIIRSRFENNGTIDANVTGAFMQINDFDSSVDDDIFFNNGTIRASNGGRLRFNQLELVGGDVEAVGSGSEVFFSTRNFPLQGATTIRDATFRTGDPNSSAGGIIRETAAAPLFLENLTNEGFFEAQHVRLIGNLNNAGTIRTVNSFNDNISLGSDVVVTGNGTLAFDQGGNAIIGEFDFENQSNRIIGKGSFVASSVIMGNEAILAPSDGGTFRTEIGVFEFDSDVLFDGSQLQFDLQGIQVGDADPSLARVNTWQDLSFPDRGLDSVNIDYDQLNIFDTLTIDGQVQINVGLANGFLPTEGQFFDVLTANQFVLNGNFEFNLPVIDGLTFDHEILNLFDATAGTNRDVLRLSFGTSAVPEPGSLLLLFGLTAVCLGRRKRTRD